jgi:hypothetical protein
MALSPRANYTDWLTATCRRNFRVYTLGKYDSKGAFHFMNWLYFLYWPKYIEWNAKWITLVFLSVQQDQWDYGNTVCQ